MIHFGKTDWIEGDRLACQLDGSPAAQHVCDVTIKISDRNLSITTQARVLSTEPGDHSQVRVTLSLEGIPATQRDDWDGWLMSVSAATSRSVSASTGDGRRSGRRVVARALLTQPRPPPPVPIRSFRPRRNAESDAAAYHVRWAGDDLLEARWRTASDLAKSLSGALGSGILDAPTGGPRSPSVSIKLHLPDGQVLRLAGRVHRQGDNTEVRFSVTRPLRHKLWRASRE